MNARIAWLGESSSAEPMRHGERSSKSQQQKSDFDDLHEIRREPSKSPARLTQECAAQARYRALRHRNDGVKAGQEVKSVVSQPHSEAKRNQAVGITNRQSKWQSALTSSPCACQPGCRDQAAPPVRQPERRRRSSPSTGASWLTCRILPSQFSTAYTGLTMPNAFSSAPKREHNRKCGQVFTFRKISDARAQRIGQQFASGQPAQDADVVVRAGMDAIQAERAIHVADFARLEKSQFASAD